MAGLDLNMFRVYGPQSVQQERPDWYNMIGGIGETLGRNIRADEQQDLQKQQLDRETQRDVRNDSRERQGMNLRADEMRMNDRRAGQREDLYKTQENRRQEQSLYERQHLIQQEHEGLFRQLQDAKTPWEAEAAAQALEREGYRVRRPDAVPAQAASPASATAAPTGAAAPPQAAPQRAPLPGEKTHLSRGAASSLSKDLAGQQSRILNAIGEPDAGKDPMTYEQAIKLAGDKGERGIEQVPGGWGIITPAENAATDADPTIATPPKRPPLPGENPSVTRSAQFLSPGDPYNKIK